MITCALDKFNSMFGLDSKMKKAEISHEYYNMLAKRKYLDPKKENTQLFRPLDELKAYCPTKVLDIIQTNAIEWGIAKVDSTFDVYAYRREYCKMDVMVQQAGFNKFKEYIEIITGLNCLVFPTLASLADAYFVKEGCFDGCYELSGIPREFIQKCVVGGRTMSSNNRTHNVKSVKTALVNDKLNDYSGKICDFDAVSLYPSAMNRVDGYLKGIPFIIPNQRYFEKFRNQMTHFFVEIEITKVGKQRNMPVFSYVNDSKRMWNDDLEYWGRQFDSDEKKTNVMYVDKTTLEDMERFQQVEYNIVKGYYFKDGYNKKVKKVIKHIFDERVKCKKAGNCIEQVYKLLMNSAYGKTLLKPVETEYKIVAKDKIDEYMILNHDSVKTYRPLNGCDKCEVVVQKSIIDHFNRVHLGCQILSMSKRIMNEVICLAEDMGITIFYQDTDSMHMYSDDLVKLNSSFKTKYGRELNGSNMGQFHSDFELDGVPKCASVNSIHLIVLGKKSYVDKLYATWDEHINEKTGETIEAGKQKGYHIRMKGIPSKVILDTCEKFDITPIELYESMYNGEDVQFDLNCGGSRSVLKYQNDMTYKTQYEGVNKTVRFW
jgi:hypothetical protein